MQLLPSSATKSDREPARAALDFVHRLLSVPSAEQPALEDVLRELAAAFGATGAGLAALPGGVPQPRGRVGAVVAWPWEVDASVVNGLEAGAAAVVLERPGAGGTLLAAASVGNAGLILWVDDANRREWSSAEKGALTLAAQVLARPTARAAADKPRWAEQVDRAGRQHSLEITAQVTRRLAHDFGNLLTGILGFTELSLAQHIPAGSPLATYLAEVHRAAQNGAQFTQQLRLFSRRQASSSGATDLAVFLAEEERRARADWGHAVGLEVRVPAGLASVAVDAEPLHHAVAALLENAREAASGANQGTVVVRARAVELTSADCLDLFGAPRPGPHIELTVTDNGPGLSLEAERRLFAEPFFSTRPRRRGFGLALVYGIAAAYRGGLGVRRAGERGTEARLVLPVALQGAAVTNAVVPSRLPQGERILVVDDDRLILQFVCASLERAGYRVQSAGGAEEALAAYAAAGPDPFRLVLTDVAMPDFSGIDLVRGLLRRDPAVRVLFMSGQVSGDAADSDIGAFHFDLLQKPFRPDGLAKAVRAALDKGTPRRGTGRSASAGNSSVASPAR